MLRAMMLLLALAALGCVPEMTDMMTGDPMQDGGPEQVSDANLPVCEQGGLRLNHLQMRGTVNSYHDFRNDQRPEIAYRHLPLDEQATLQGIRQFDFDLSSDRISFIDLAPQYVEHPSDAESHCGGFLGCLWELRDWSDAHPDHPLAIVLVGESHLRGDDLPHLQVQLDDIERAIVLGVGRERVLTPEDVRGDFPSLRAAIECVGWPAVEETRGKFLFVLNDRSVPRVHYLLNGGLDPDDRLLFVIGDPDAAAEPATADEVIFTFEPDELFGFETDPAMLPRMTALADSGYLVHAITDDPVRAAELRAAGAHMVGTRYPDELWPAADDPIVCNPLTWPAGCDPATIDPGP